MDIYARLKKDIEKIVDYEIEPFEMEEDDIIGLIEDLVGAYENLEEEFEDYKQKYEELLAVYENLKTIEAFTRTRINELKKENETLRKELKKRL